MDKEPLNKNNLREFLDKKPKYPTTLNLRSCKYKITNDEFASYIPDVIKTLNLSHNELTEVVNLGGLTKIRELYLEHNQIADVSFAGLENCTMISLGHNRLEYLSDMSALKKLTSLDLSSNFLLAGFQQLSKLKTLKYLDLSCNNISFRKPTLVKNIVTPLKSLTKLVSLDLTSNPCVDSIPDFRLVLLYHLPHLKTINGVDVTKKEKSSAKKPGSHRETTDKVSALEQQQPPQPVKSEKKLRRLSTHFRRGKSVQKGMQKPDPDRRKSMILSSPRIGKKSSSPAIPQRAAHLDVGAPSTVLAASADPPRNAHLNVKSESNRFGSSSARLPPGRHDSSESTGSPAKAKRAPHLDVGGGSSVKRAPHLDVGGGSSVKRAPHLDVGGGSSVKRAPHLDVGGGGSSVKRAPHLDVGGGGSSVKRAPHLDVGGGGSSVKRAPHLDVGGDGSSVKRAPHLDVGSGSSVKRAPHLDVGGGSSVKRAPHLDVGGGGSSVKRASHLDVGGGKKATALPSTPEEIEAYKEKMIKQYEERQATSSKILSSSQPSDINGKPSESKSLSAMKRIDMKSLISVGGSDDHHSTTTSSSSTNIALESLIKKRTVKGADVLLKGLIDIIGSFCIAVSPEDCVFDDNQMDIIKDSLRQLVGVIRTMFPKVREYTSTLDPLVGAEIIRSAQALQQQMKAVIIAVKSLSEDKSPLTISSVVVASQALVETAYELFLACELDGVPSCDNITEEIRQCASFTTKIIRLATGKGSTDAQVSQVCDAAVLRTEKMLHKVNIKAPEIQHLPSQKELLEVTSSIDDRTNELVKAAKLFTSSHDATLVRKMTQVARGLAEDFKSAINLLASTKKVVALSSSDEVGLYDSATSTLKNALDAFNSASSQIDMSTEEEMVGKQLRKLTTSVSDLRRRLTSSDASTLSVKNRYLQVTEATEIALDLLECVEPAGKKCADPQLAEQLALYGKGIRYYAHLLKISFAVHSLGLRKDNILHISTAINGISSCVVLMTNIYSLVLIMG